MQFTRRRRDRSDRCRVRLHADPQQRHTREDAAQVIGQYAGEACRIRVVGQYTEGADQQRRCRDHALGGGRDRYRAVSRFPDGGIEAEAAPAQGLDVALCVATVAQCLARALDTGRDGALRDESTVPHGIDQLFVAEHLAGVAGEVDDQVEHPGFDVTPLTRMPQLVGPGVEHKVVELQSHGCPRYAFAAPGHQRSATRWQAVIGGLRKSPDYRQGRRSACAAPDCRNAAHLDRRARSCGMYTGKVPWSTGNAPAFNSAPLASRWAGHWSAHSENIRAA